MNAKPGLIERKQQAARLRGIRENIGLTQERFAELIDITLSAYKKLESGENQISLATLKKLHDRLNISSDFVLYDNKQDVNKVWADLLNCSERDKMFIFMKMYKYFTEYKVGVFPLENDDKVILDFMDKMYDLEETVAAAADAKK